MSAAVMTRKAADDVSTARTVSASVRAARLRLPRLRDVTGCEARGENLPGIAAGTARHCLVDDRDARIGLLGRVEHLLAR